MECGLTREQQEKLLKKVYSDLKEVLSSKDDINIDQYIKDFYNNVLEAGADEVTALTYASLVPKYVQITHTLKGDVIGDLVDKGLDLNQLNKLVRSFTDMANVSKLVQIVDPKDSSSSIKNASDLAKEKANKPKPKEDTLPQKAARILEFMFKPQTPLSTTGQQGVKVKNLTDQQIASIIKKSPKDKPNQKAIDEYRATHIWSNIKNSEEAFYYDFFNVFADALEESNGNPEELTINGHTGFKLKLINKSQIPIEKAKKSEQDFVASNPNYKWSAGAGAVVSDNEGNILYFDENYKVVSEDVGLPIYHNIRNIQEKDGTYLPGGKNEENKEVEVYDGSKIQSAQDIAKNRFISSKEFETLEDVRAVDPALYKKYVAKAKADLQVQLKLMHDTRAYLVSDPSNSILTDITNVSRGVVNVNKGGQAKWSEINWAESDIVPTSDNTIVATRDNPALNEKAGTAYLRVPGNASIELQKDNISNEDADKLASLLVDDIKEIKNNREIALSFDAKMKLFRSFSIEYHQTMSGKKTQNPIQFIAATQKILFNGTDITELDNAKELIKQAITTLTRSGSIYNNKFGQYAFSGTDIQGNFVDFSLEDGILTEISITLAEHIKQHSTLKVIPNETNQIVYLNGYFTFNAPEFEGRHATTSKTIKTIDEITEDFEKVKAEQDPVEFVNRQKAVYRGVSLDTQYTLNDDGSLTLHTQKNFSGKQSGISFTPYLDTAFDYSRRSKTGSSKKTGVSGTIIKVNISKNIMDSMSVEAYDELSYIGGDVTLPKGSYEIIEGRLPGAERGIEAVQDFMLSENSILLNSVQASSDQVILEKALQTQIAADSASEYIEYEGNTGENFVDNIENIAIVDAFGSSDPGNWASNMLAKAIIYKYYKAFGKNLSKLKKFVGKESVYMNLAYGTGDYSYSDLIDIVKTGLENGDYEASFNKATRIDTDGNFKLQESVKQLTQSTSGVEIRRVNNKKQELSDLEEIASYGETYSEALDNLIKKTQEIQESLSNRLKDQAKIQSSTKEAKEEYEQHKKELAKVNEDNNNPADKNLQSIESYFYQKLQENIESTKEFKESKRIEKLIDQINNIYAEASSYESKVSKDVKEISNELASLSQPAQSTTEVEVSVETIEDKIAALKSTPDEDTSTSKSKLYRSRLLKMESTPKEIAKASKWFHEESNLANAIAYKEMFDVVNSNGWAEFKNGAIIMYAGSDSTAIYHEAWHAFSQHFLTKEQKKSLYKEVLATSQGKKAVAKYAKELKKSVNELTPYEINLALEELIAEDFRKYAMSDGKKVLEGRPQRNTIFRKILNFLKKVLGKITGITYVDSNTYQLTELFNKLYIGEINEYTPSASNVYFKEGLYKSYKDGVTSQDTKLLVDSMNSVMLEFLEQKNIEHGTTAYGNGFYNGDVEKVNATYNHIKNTFKKQALQLYAEAEKLSGTDKVNKLKYANKLHTAFATFGDHADGLLKYHKDNSELISDKIKDIDKESFDNSTSDEVTAAFDKPTNSLSLVDYSSNEILSLVRGLKKYEDGKVVYNVFGFAELTPWQEVWKTLISTLSNDNESPRIMKAALQKIAPLTPWVDDLLIRLGPTDSPFSSVQALWTGFWAAFYFSHEKLYQVLVNEEFIDNEDGDVTASTFEVLAGYASAVFRKVEMDFRSNFKISNHSNPFIIDVDKVGNVLDLPAIIEEFSNNKLSSNKEKFDFITAIGIPLTKNNDILNGLSDVNVGFIYDKLAGLNKHKIQITDLIPKLKENIVLDSKESTDKYKSEATNLNKILNLEAKYSGNYSNSSVMTADGNIAWEQTQMATFSKMIKHLNKDQTRQELFAIPSMSFLDPRNNTSTQASNILNSLFDTNGERRKGVQITIDNLNGTQNIINNSYSDTAYSEVTSKLDKYTRLQQDIYSFLVGGKASLMTPGDKGTILSFNINDINTPRSSDKHLYVDMGDFGKKGGEMNLGIEKTYGLMMPYLDGELKRIERIKTDPNMPAYEGYTVPILNEDGTVKTEATGLKLGIFDDIFHDTEDDAVKSDILKYKSVAEIPGELQGKMIHQFNTYMTFQMQQTLDTMDRVLFIDANLKSLAEAGVGRKLNAEDLKRVIIGTYTANKFINNAESLVLFFGDIAQYKDFDKRNPGINSTGRMFRVDQDFYDFINNEIGRGFATKHNGETTQSPYAAWNGILQTAILKDNRVDSKAYDEYLKFAIKTMGKNKAVNLLAPYKQMEEGDGQGWITLDTYRILGRASDRWSPEQESLYKQILEHPQTVDPLKVLEYFPARKYQYFGPLAVQGIHATAFHKYSLMPLIPEVIKGANLQKLNEMMMEQGIDYAVYKSGSKVSNLVKEGTSGGDVVYKKGEDRVIDKSVQFTKNPIYLEYLKDQLDINSTFKKKVIFSTQLRKLVEEGLIENGVPVDFKTDIKDNDERVKAWKKAQSKGETTPFYKKYKTYESKIEKLVHLRMAELAHEVKGKDGKTDITKLVKFINKELDRQDLTDHEKQFIGVDSGGDLIHDLSISPSAAKIEKVLTSIVNRRLIRQKINGEPLVQISSSMFEQSAPTEDDLIKYGQRELASYMPGKVKANGEIDNTSSMEVKVALQGNFTSLIHLQYDDNSKVAVYTKREFIEADGKVRYIKELDQEATLKRLNEVINSEAFLANEDNVKMITMVGVRIPVQGLNSMEFMRIKAFLPPSAGNIIIPPAEIVAKSGSDFDIDKLTIMMPSINIIGGRPEILKELDSGLSPKATVARIEELKLLTKAARTEKNIAKKASDKKFETLQDAKKLTEELVIQKAEILDPFIEASKKLDRDIERYKDRITKFAGREDLTIAQEEAHDEAWAQLEHIQNKQDQVDAELNAAKLEFAIVKKLVNSKEVVNSKESKAYVAAMAKLDELKKEAAGLSPEAVENSIMFSIKGILEMPHNFLNLITPNDTGLVKPAANARAHQREYKDTEGVWGTTEGVSPTRNLEIGYNIYKHESNSVGKETLGLGAVDNTFNTIFNRIGAYMNKEYTASKHTRRAIILMEHNKLNGENISLSHLYDVKNENKISDVINQLLNGWLDVAKDAWIFDIQGNKQLTPVMMFLLQSGVTFQNAVDFISNPIVKKYVKEQKIVTTSFAKAIGEAPKTPSGYKNKAQKNVFGALGILSEVSFTNKNGALIISGKSIYEATLNRTKGMDFTKTSENIAELDEASAMKDKNAIAAFLHYLELEKLSDGVRDIKMTLNYDTARSTTLFDAQKAKADLVKLKANDLFPPELIDNFFKETPVGSFNISDFQLELWAPLFKIRNSQMVNDLLLDMMSSFDKSRDMVKMFGSEEAYIEEFKNGLISKLFIDEIKNFSIKDGYRGLNVERTTIEKVAHLDKGVSVVDGKIYIDPTILAIQFTDHLYTEGVLKPSKPKVPAIVSKTTTDKFKYETLGLAPVERAAFATETGRNDYINFSIEREYLRATNPFSEFSKTPYFKKAYKRNLAQRPKIQLDKIEDGVKVKVDETLDQRQQRLLRNTYEELLRDMALDNTLNFWKLFKSHNNIADQLFEIREMHPSLRDDFEIIGDFIMSEGGKKNTKGKRDASQGYKNLTLRDNRVDMEMFEVYHENMTELSEGTVIPIDSMEDKLENTRLNEFFSRLPLVAFLQSGLDIKTSLSMMRAMPPGKITNIIESGKGSDKFTRGYLEAFVKKFNTHNVRTNISTRKRLQDYATESDENLNRSLTKHDFTIDHTIPMNFEDGTGGRKMRVEFKGKSTFDLILSGDRTATSRSERHNVKKGDIIEFYNTETKRTVLTRATSDEYSLLDVGPEDWSKLEGWDEGRWYDLVQKDYVQFQFEKIDIDEILPSEQVIEINPNSLIQLEALIKNNPDVIFVLEGSEASEDMYVQNLGKIVKTDNMMPIITRIRPSTEAKDLWSNNTVSDNKQYISDSLDAIEELYDAGKKIAFINPTKGYGTYMLDKNSQGKLIDSDTYKYLSVELFSRFKYSNRFSKAMTETQGLIKENQDFKEFSIEIPFGEIIEAQERLTCKT